MELNFLILPLAALIPLFIGAIWYNPKVFGNAWMQASGMTEEKIKSGNMLLIFGLTYLFSLFITVVLVGTTIHQFGTFQALEGLPGLEETGSELHTYFQNFMDQYGHNHRNFKHGLLHGGLTGLFFAFPLIAINALFERRSWKYIWIHTGYWMVCIMLMSGVISAFM